MRGDQGSIVLGWLTRLAAVVALFGLVAFDGVALVKTNFSAADHATSAASAGADSYKATHDVQKAYEAALQVAVADGGTIDPKTFQVTPANGHVALEVTETATTLWLHKIGPLKKWAVVHAGGEGNPPS